MIGTGCLGPALREGDRVPWWPGRSPLAVSARRKPRQGSETRRGPPAPIDGKKARRRSCTRSLRMGRVGSSRSSCVRLSDPQGRQIDGATRRPRSLDMTAPQDQATRPPARPSTARSPILGYRAPRQVGRLLARDHRPDERPGSPLSQASASAKSEQESRSSCPGYRRATLGPEQAIAAQERCSAAQRHN